MTKEAINQAMAGIEGWKPTTDGGICWDADGNTIIEYPNYTEDLNAVARVVAKLQPFYDLQNAQKELRKGVLGRDDPRYTGELSWLGESKVCNATAAQRCEAILRATGKWKE